LPPLGGQLPPDANLIGSDRRCHNFEGIVAEDKMKVTSSRRILPSKSRAVYGPVAASTNRLAHRERTERSTEAGQGPELGKAGNQLEHRLIAILAHELRNPLSSIMLVLRALRGHHLDEPMARHAHDVAERQARHMARIIEEVLDLCRAGQNKLSLCKERVDLATVVAGAIETAGAFLATRSHHLIVSLPEAPVSLVADPSRLNQILTNLLTNAAKYTDPGGEICLTAEVEAGAVVLKVRDNGMGIAPDLLPRVFDLFQQGDGPGDRACGGLGIGLALVKSLVELHGGNASASSDGPGRGSQFVVRLLDCAPNVLSVASATGGRALESEDSIQPGSPTALTESVQIRSRPATRPHRFRPAPPF
jgi:signal transduction histidine kinase